MYAELLVNFPDMVRVRPVFELVFQRKGGRNHTTTRATRTSEIDPAPYYVIMVLNSAVRGCQQAISQENHH